MNRKTKCVFSLRPSSFIIVPILLLSVLLLSCEKDEPEPVNEEEVITTVEVTLTPDGGGIPVTLKFYDADGELGSIAPLVTVSGSLKSSTTYAAEIKLLNETENPPGDISVEVKEEANEHLVCFEVTGNIVIQYLDTDANNLPLGLTTSWTTGAPGEANVTIALKHQPGTKTGECPGVGETDVEVSFSLLIE
jgi:hypothetical protein